MAFSRRCCQVVQISAIRRQQRRGGAFYGIAGRCLAHFPRLHFRRPVSGRSRICLVLRHTFPSSPPEHLGMRLRCGSVSPVLLEVECRSILIVERHSRRRQICGTAASRSVQGRRRFLASRVRKVVRTSDDLHKRRLMLIPTIQARRASCRAHKARCR